MGRPTVSVADANMLPESSHDKKAQSTPMPAPFITSFLLVSINFNTERFNTLSAIFPLLIAAPFYCAGSPAGAFSAGAGAGGAPSAGGWIGVSAAGGAAAAARAAATFFT